MRLVDALQDPSIFDHPVTGFEVIETHISWVLLTGPFAYKIKKPVNFGFLDFSTLEKRHQCCLEELRLNRRLAPHIYADVIEIRGSKDNPSIKGDDEIVEYAIKMHQFSQSAQLDRVLERQELKPSHINNMARTVADFHQRIDIADPQSSFGDFEHIAQPIRENFDQIEGSIHIDEIQETLTDLRSWCEYELRRLGNVIKQRKANGFIRECHGDMHLRNMAIIHGEIVIFDCIEFNKNLSYIDVISEVAFIIMDLEDRHQYHLAQHFLNDYLEYTGDYEGLQLLQLYKVYRAMVRAKVAALRTTQEQINSSEYALAFSDIIQYLQLAASYTHRESACLLINYGLSGSGKTTNTRLLTGKFNAIQLRSDVERKRIFAHADNEDIYTSQANDQTYARLQELATIILDLGYSVIIDAAHLQSQRRQQFITLAEKQHVPWLIMSYKASPDILRKRIKQRLKDQQDASDADLDVLELQLETCEPLSKQELERTLVINTEHPLNIDNIIFRINELCFL